eukprot:5958600-Prymnesium_polylepis.1
MPLEVPRAPRAHTHVAVAARCPRAAVAARTAFARAAPREAFAPGARVCARAGGRHVGARHALVSPRRGRLAPRLPRISRVTPRARRRSPLHEPRAAAARAGGARRIDGALLPLRDAAGRLHQRGLLRRLRPFLPGAP